MEQAGKLRSEWDVPVAVEQFPRDISDEELALLQRLHPEMPLPELRGFLLEWWKRTMQLRTQKYACVRNLLFLRTSVDKNPKYQEALSRKDKGRWWIDIGSAFGQDVRLPVLEGWPPDRMLATDLIPDLWEAGLSLYPNPDNIRYVTANVLDTSPAADRLHAYDGSAGVVSSNYVLHTLGRAQVDGMLRAMLCLLVPGGLVLGSCGGSASSPEGRSWSEYDPDRWLHGATSLQAAFQSAGFDQIQIESYSLPEEVAAAHKDVPGLSFSAVKPL